MANKKMTPSKTPKNPMPKALVKGEIKGTADQKKMKKKR